MLMQQGMRHFVPQIGIQRPRLISVNPADVPDPHKDGLFVATQRYGRHQMLEISSLIGKNEDLNRVS